MTLELVVPRRLLHASVARRECKGPHVRVLALLLERLLSVQHLEQLLVVGHGRRVRVILRCQKSKVVGVEKFELILRVSVRHSVTDSG